MSRIETKCPICEKRAYVVKSFQIGKLHCDKYSCGHNVQCIFRGIQVSDGHKLVCLDCHCYVGAKSTKHNGHNVREIPINRDFHWLDLFGYQKETIEFAERANFNCLIGHEQGLGKTPIAAKILAYHRELLTPALIVCPAGLTPNWQKEMFKWYFQCHKNVEDIPLIHEGTLLPFLDNQRIHIISNMRLAKDAVFESAQTYGFKSLIVDECHHFKNDNSDRTNALIKIARNIPHRILLSGTSVLNRTTEFFNTLHLIAPQKFPTKWHLTRLCIRDDKGRPLAIAPYWKDHFNTQTKDCVIRRTKKELYKELPPKMINDTYVTVTDNKGFVNLYAELQQELEDALKDSETTAMSLIAIMQKMWQYTAIAKTPHAIDRLIEFLENTDELDKIAIATHHIAPREFLKKALIEKGFEFAEISSQNPEMKLQNEIEFRDNPKCRVLVASILGAGEGRNLQFCKNAIMLERYWNRKKEEQFEDRFYLRGVNPDEEISEKDKEPVIIDYILADNTIDEFFVEMNRLKDEIVNAALDKDYFADENFVRNLAAKVIKKRIQYTGM